MANDIKSSLSELDGLIRDFYVYGAWIPLGYESFREFWDNELGAVPIATGLRNWVIHRMFDDAPRTSTGRLVPGARQDIADTLGVTDTVVNNVLTRGRPRIHIPQSDDELVPLTVGIPWRWRRAIASYAREKNINVSDVIRPVISAGMKRRGVDVDEIVLIKPTRRLRK